jgi:hypothetical protein
VHAVAQVAPAPEEAIQRLSDLDHMRDVFLRHGVGCAEDLVAGEPHAGVGATGRIRWTPSWMNRRLTVRVDGVTPSRVTWEHTGQYNFFLLFRVEADGQGSRVTMEVPVDPMPWPVRRLWFEKIAPAWSACLTTTVQGL